SVAGGADNRFTLGSDDRLTVNGNTAASSITAENASTQIQLNGTVQLFNGGTLTVSGGTTYLASTSRFEGGTSATAGTLLINNGNLSIDEPLVSARPKITFDNAGAQSITAPNANSSIQNVGTITKNGVGMLTINSNVNNIEASTIQINAGTLLLGASDQLANTNNMVLGGGTFATGGHDEILAS